jgi:hypothetical protein
MLVLLLVVLVVLVVLVAVAVLVLVAVGGGGEEAYKKEESYFMASLRSLYDSKHLETPRKHHYYACRALSTWRRAPLIACKGRGIRNHGALSTVLF